MRPRAGEQAPCGADLIEYEVACHRTTNRVERCHPLENTSVSLRSLRDSVLEDSYSTAPSASAGVPASKAPCSSDCESGEPLGSAPPAPEPREVSARGESKTKLLKVGAESSTNRKPGDQRLNRLRMSACKSLIQLFGSCWLCIDLKPSRPPLPESPSHNIQSIPYNKLCFNVMQPYNAPCTQMPYTAHVHNIPYDLL